MTQTLASVSIVLLLWALLPSSHASSFQGELFSSAYYHWFYRRYRGGAWIAHQERHECFGHSTMCTFVSRNDMTKLSVNTTIVQHLDTVEVTFAIKDIEIDDLVAVYLVDSEKVTKFEGDPLSDFIDYVYANESRTIHSGVFSIVFGPLVNMRASYQFKYLRKLESVEYNEDGQERPRFAVVGDSPFIEMERGHTEPLQIRLALTENKGELRVTWVSGQTAGPYVKFKLASGQLLESRANATFGSYDAQDLCEPSATNRSSVYFRHPGYLYDAVMTDLIPGRKYVYRVGSDTGVLSPEIEFIFPTALQDYDADKQQRPQSFFVFGDLGTSVLDEPVDELDIDQSPERHFTGLNMVSRPAKWSDERSVMERICQDLDESLQDDARIDSPEYAALVHVGDISYAKGKTYIWDQYGAIVQSVASRLPYMVGVGNHEYDYIENGEGHDLSGEEAALSNGWHPKNGNFKTDSNGECGVPFARRFHMPQATNEGANPPFWYSFQVGLTHHIVLSSEHRCTSGSSMRKWLERELEQYVDRNVTPWLIVHLHRPLYCSEMYEADNNVAKILRDCFEDLFATNNVDFVFSGHYHAYERTFPVYHGICQEHDQKAQAPIHIMIGSGGAELDDISYFQSFWSRSRQQEYGYGRLHIYNASHARFEFVRARDRVVTDAIVVISNHMNAFEQEN
ncbi:RxLR-like protein [Plasmopara halstedii]|uniref:Purple acid phosphatase n=1 Tax=Plasmopara halstedii TaxID=4781 RepID=A0A0P1AXZ2_PLAHL|nr:RxLR-like protein [Plasmopara halstedii]CEG46928.1 RxLR-like protein [Plasmopara halstedii]|eukprot:XP_024583297.1 RxLR-like protein [Plasmopara halstedii]